MQQKFASQFSMRQPTSICQTQQQNIYNKQLSSIIKILLDKNTNPYVIHRVTLIINTLLAENINILQLRNLCIKGIPQQSHQLRMYCWMVLLEILPTEKSKWETILKCNHQYYLQFVNEFMNKSKYPNFPYGQKYSQHLPQWKQLEQDYFVWQQIEKDTIRTHSSFSFFSIQYQMQQKPFFKTGGRKQKQKIIRGEQSKQYTQALETLDQRIYKYDIMTKILFIISKFNKKLKYVQGMNQILAPIFYICNIWKDIPEETICMNIFLKVVIDIKQLHMKQFDKLDTGLEGRLDKINKLLKVVDYQLWYKLKSLNIKPFFYAFRWITLFFAQQFQLCDILTLWDHIFCIPDRSKYMNIVCIAILECKRSGVLKCEFGAAMQILQKHDLNVRQVIAKSIQIYEKYGNLDINREAELMDQTISHVQSNLQKQKYSGFKILKKIFK